MRERVVRAVVAEIDRQEVYNRVLAGALQVDGFINVYEFADAILAAVRDPGDDVWREIERVIVEKTAATSDAGVRP